MPSALETIVFYERLSQRGCLQPPLERKNIERIGVEARSSSDVSSETSNTNNSLRSHSEVRARNALRFPKPPLRAMFPGSRSSSRSRSPYLSQGDAQRFRETQAWARSLNLCTRRDELEDSSPEDGERNVGDAQPEASQVQLEHPEVGETQPEVGETQPEDSLLTPDVGETQLEDTKQHTGSLEVEVGDALPELSLLTPEVGEIQPEASQVQLEHPEVGETQPEVGETQSEDSLLTPEVGETQPEDAEQHEDSQALEVGENQPEDTKQHEDSQGLEAGASEHELGGTQHEDSQDPDDSQDPQDRETGRLLSRWESLSSRWGQDERL